MLSASKELEPGARAMLLLAQGLFRFDVTIDGDTLRTTVRNLSDGVLRMGRDSGGRAALGFGEIDVYEPAQAGLSFTLGSGADVVEVNVQVATLRFAERGTVRITAQGILRGPSRPSAGPSSGQT